MTEEDWDALIIDVPEEAKRWFTFISEGTHHHDHQPNSGSADVSSKRSSGEEDEKEEQDSCI